MSLLEQLKTQPATKKPSNGSIRVEKVGPPSFAKRVAQWAAVVVATQVFAVLFTATPILLGTSSDVMFTDLPHVHPYAFAFCSIAIPLLAIAAASVLVLKKVYLAQLVGLAAGLTSAPIMLGVEVLLGVTPEIYQWPLLTFMGGVMGFLGGLVVAGELIVLPAFEYKPVESWDQTTKPTVRELDPPSETRLNRLLLSFVVGVSVNFLLYALLTQLLKPIYNYNYHSVKAVLDRIDTPLEAFILLLAGVIAGSGTKSGLAQGFLSGLMFFGFDFAMNYYYLHRADMMETEVIVHFAMLNIIPPIFGGLVGRRVFPPTRIYRSGEDLEQLSRSYDSF